MNFEPDKHADLCGRDADDKLDEDERVESVTQSLCPQCLKVLEARRVVSGDNIYQLKTCPDHGTFRTVIWRGSPDFSTWKRPKKPSSPLKVLTESKKGCPFDCGPCENHGQHTCTALIEITARCNMACPVCFADAGKSIGSDPSIENLQSVFDTIMAAGGKCNIQLSGGEPTVREDLTEIIRIAVSKGFEFIQLNTNGLKLSENPEYALNLKKAGLSSVFLQFDGTSDHIFRKIRGRDLLHIKEKAIENCAAAGLGIVLVPVLIPELNINDIGNIIRFGINHAPAVRGVHFQPVSYFGRYPEPPSDDDRITLAEIIHELEKQTGGMVAKTNFQPPACEHSLCSFHGNFMIRHDNTLKHLGAKRSGQCCSTGEPKNIRTSPEDIPTAKEGHDKSVAFTARQWSAPVLGKYEKTDAVDDFDLFLERARTHTFSISAMAFQDVWNIDLERVRGCCIHVATMDGRMIPFCAYNLTSASGEPLHRKKL